MVGDENEPVRQLLQDAVVRCSERCLYQSAKWAAEMLTSIATISPDPPSPTDTEVDLPMEDWDSLPLNPLVSQNESYKEARLEAAELQKYFLAKTYFDCREYDRCAAVFLPMTLPKGAIGIGTSGKGKEAGDALKEIELSSRGYPHLSQKALFLALYAKYMSGEKRKDEESETILGPADGGATVNRELEGITRALEARFELYKDEEEGQGWLEYLYGIVLAKGKNKDAQQWFVKSVSRCPHNWGAWLELSSLLGSVDDLREVETKLPHNIMGFIFRVYASQELFQAQPDIFQALKGLKKVFPTSSFLKTQKALLCYHERDFEKAERTFSKILHRDPLRIDSIDTYSNILFVMSNSPKLAFLAQLSTATDKFRPETCCVVGNYYALKAEHEKAVLYFRRALTLDRNFQSAWTLMGHEYVELRNTHAAIECYRRAVDVNRRDYRAWYGLGQTYEILEMALYALYYYERAAAACPHDPKMWAAVGSCLSKLDRWAQAAKAYKRALVTGAYYHGGSSGSFGAGGGMNMNKSGVGAAQGGGVGGGSGSQRSGNSDRTAVLDPEILYAIAICYDRLGDGPEKEAYLELTLAQEEGPSWGEDESDAARRASAAAASQSQTQSQSQVQAQSQSQSQAQTQDKRGGWGIGASTSGIAAATSGVGGVGVTATTSKARMWLARIEFAKGGRESLRRAYELANELCQDGWEVEEAKALIKEIRGRLGEVGG